jgi:RHS repeat-associated protein
LLIGERTCAATPGGKTGDALEWKIEYGDADLISKMIDPAGRATRITYSFDEGESLRRSVLTSVDRSAVIREFDGLGRRSTLTDSAGTVTYGYDDLDRLNLVQRDGFPAITYTDDTLDRIKTLQVGDFYRIQYTYDFLGRLASMATSAGVVRYDYVIGQGKVVRTLPHGLKTIWEYSTGGNLRQMTHGLARNPKSNHYTVPAEYSYRYRPDGLIEAIKERSGAGEFPRRYESDTVGRLVRAEGPSRQQYAYAYDALGSRVKALATHQALQVLPYDWAGRLISVDGSPVTHDAAGNLTAMNVGGKTMRYRYNPHNQLIEVLGGKVSYEYDGDGQLIRRRTGRTETTFIPDPLSDYWQPLVMDDNTSHRTLVVWDGATPLMMIRDGETEFLLHDHLGSVRMVVDLRGRLIRRIDYEPYGSMTNPAMAKEFAPRFAGLFWEPVGNVYLTRARAREPELARFLQMDSMHRTPFGSQEGLSAYAYCGGDPINYQDPNGATPIPAELLHNDHWGPNIGRRTQVRYNQRIKARIFGGVNLSADDKSIHNFFPHSDLSQLPKKERAGVREKIMLADSLEGVVPKKGSCLRAPGSPTIPAPGHRISGRRPARGQNPSAVPRPVHRSRPGGAPCRRRCDPAGPQLQLLLRPPRTLGQGLDPEPAPSGNHPDTGSPGRGHSGIANGIRINHAFEQLLRTVVPNRGHTCP